jgi:hypothetical protein
MGRSSLRFLPVVALLVLAAQACSSSGGGSSSGTTTTTPSGGAGGALVTSTTSSAGGSGGATGGAGGATPGPSAICKDLGLAARPWSEGPYGTHRGEVADDFTVDLADGTTFHFKDRFSGCESYVFTPDVLPVSDLDPTSLWESQADLKALAQKSPKNVHYFFVSRKKTDAEAQANIDGMQKRVEDMLATLPEADALHWRDRLHVVKTRSQSLGGWLAEAIESHGRIGISIDRRQIIRGAGSLADVKRFDSALDAAGKWPWKSNLAYLANDVAYFNAQSDLADQLDQDGATVVDLFQGEVLSEYADTMATLPSSSEMSQYDTLEIEVTQQCPDPDQIELGNCGAWDYLAGLYVADDPNNMIEIARFITAYHRETHWVVDASSMLPLLASGGEHAFRWSFAPSWNVQPTATKLSLRFSNKNKGMRPTSATFLYAGGTFDQSYNLGYAPIDVPIPATAKKVELFVIVTGHGAVSPSSCAEFCNHQHEITVNGVKHVKGFSSAGTQDKCMPSNLKGMTPNQAGTWWFGRGGWCPGQQVDPWVVDVTGDVTPGQTATISYRGLYKSMDPPNAGGGDINLVSYLVVSE